MRYAWPGKLYAGTSVMGNAAITWLYETELCHVERFRRRIRPLKRKLIRSSIGRRSLWSFPPAMRASSGVLSSNGLRMQGLPASQVLIIDSSSEDGTGEMASAEGYQVFRINRCDFNHGGTRQLALNLVPWASIVVYLTQDSVLATPDSLDLLLSAFEDESVAAAYGRQLPRPHAGPIEAHARLFNYPPKSEVRDFESRHALGIKATFLSNSFAAYRVATLMEVGGFPSGRHYREDALGHRPPSPLGLEGGLRRRGAGVPLASVHASRKNFGATSTPASITGRSRGSARNLAARVEKVRAWLSLRWLI